MNAFEKRLLTLRQGLVYAGYYDALVVLNNVIDFHSGVRKDGVTPEFDHQVRIALYLLTLPDLMHREAVICTVFAHDTPEDYGVSVEEVTNGIQNAETRALTMDAVKSMTKKFRNEIFDLAALFDSMSRDPVASIVKGADRIHNLQSMIGVFTPEKQHKYIDDVKTYFLPMLKKARRMFPHQTMAYENIKFVLTSQIELLEHSLSARKTTA